MSEQLKSNNMSQHEEEGMIEVPAVMVAVVRQGTQKLTDQEFASIYRAVALRMNVKRIIGYEKVAPLFTQADGTQMEQATWEAFRVLFQERFPAR
jgi:hypothetical protein